MRSIVAFAAGVVASLAPLTAAAAEPLSPDVMQQMNRSRDRVLVAAREIDRIIGEVWTLQEVSPAPKASDPIFMRRVYLDITGTIPDIEEALAFLDSTEKNRRQLLIDQLLMSDGYVSHYFNYWADVLRLKSSSNNVDLHAYIEWVKDSLRRNQRYDAFVRDLLTADGHLYENGAVGYFLRDQGMPLDHLSNTMAVFLGAQVGCAQCHDHPFNQWTQKQFYELASFTWGVNTRSGGQPFRQKRRAVDQMVRQRKLQGRQRQVVNQLIRFNEWNLQDAPNRKLRFPKDYQYDDAKPNELVVPKVIFGPDAKIKSDDARREAFAEWLTAKENPLFARNIANRLWKKVMGVGLIEPVDDIEDAKSNRLLDYLTRIMISTDFNIKTYLRVLFNTDLYQRRAVFKDIEEQQYLFPGPTLRRLTAEQLWDSLVTLSTDDPGRLTYEDNNPYTFPRMDFVNSSPNQIISRALQVNQQREERRKNRPGGLARASEMRQPAPPGHFLRDFGQSDRDLIEGANTDPTVTQILTLINGNHHYQIIRNGSLLMKHLNRARNERERTRIIYLSILGREPNRDERKLAFAVFQNAKQKRKGNVELIWVLLNTPEFMFIQ